MNTEPWYDIQALRASKEGNLFIFQEIFNRNIFDRYYVTNFSILLAVRYNHIEIVNYLFEYDPKNIDYATHGILIDIAVNNKDVAMLTYLKTITQKI